MLPHPTTSRRWRAPSARPRARLRDQRLLARRPHEPADDRLRVRRRPPGLRRRHRIGPAGLRVAGRPGRVGLVAYSWLCCAGSRRYAAGQPPSGAARRTAPRPIRAAGHAPRTAGRRRGGARCARSRARVPSVDVEYKSKKGSVSVGHSSAEANRSRGQQDQDHHSFCERPVTYEPTAPGSSSRDTAARNAITVSVARQANGRCARRSTRHRRRSAVPDRPRRQRRRRGTASVDAVGRLQEAVHRRVPRSSRSRPGDGRSKSRRSRVL